MWNGELGNEAQDGNGKAKENERRALLIFVGEPSKGQDHDACEKVDGDGQELGVCSAVAESVYDGGHGGREAAWTVRLEALDLVCALER